MFTILLFSVYSFALVISSSVDTQFNEKYINGKQYTIKGIDKTLTQHVSNHGQCTVEINDQNGNIQTLMEGEIIKLKSKWFKVEDCRLNRAYIAACGSKLFSQIRSIVCSYVTEHSAKKIIKRRQTDEELIDSIDQTYYGICCQSACTVSDLLQYCPSK